MKKLFVVLICLFLLIPKIKAEDVELATNAKSAILMEPTTGEILFSKDADTKYAPASMTKMMSMLLFIEAIEAGNLKWDEEITVSSHAASMGGSQIFLEENEKMIVTDLFKGTAIGSANDATVALAERVGGTEEAFVELMNKRAQELGLKNTNFKNATGLDEANHYSSAHDMALIAQELVKHTKILEFTSTYEDYLRQDTGENFWLVNTNKLVRFYSGADGLKTGYTKEAGYCLTATATKDNMRLIAVVFGEADSATRNSEVSAMLDYGFNAYDIENLLSSKSSIGTIEVIKGKKTKAEIVPAEDVNILFKTNETKKSITYEVNVTNYTAPIKVGDIIGDIIIKEDGKKIQTIGVTVAETVEKASLWRLFGRYLADIVEGEI